MSSENKAALRVAIEETVWFQKGQEVNEMLSVQLTPDVVIEQEGNYVHVRGSLFLEGEYKPLVSEEDEASLRDLSPHRYVEDVQSREDGTCDFYHNFTVDISIPLDRVTDLEDVYFSIESFDYDIVEQSNLKLYADVSIGGLCEDNRQPAEEAQQQDVFVEVAEELQSQEVEDIQFEPFRVEVKRDPYLQERVEEPQWDGYAPFSPFISQYGGGVQPSVSPYQPPVYQEPVQPVYQEAIQPVYQAPQYEPVDVNRYYNSVQQPAVEEVVAPEAYDEHYQPKDENALYLTKLFQSREADEGFSRLRMYIVQQGDTIESIADHYGIREDAIMRENNLEDNYVSPGKVIYIPQKVKFQL